VISVNTTYYVDRGKFELLTKTDDRGCRIAYQS